jgi:hypothetical protein
VDLSVTIHRMEVTVMRKIVVKKNSNYLGTLLG